ncbi:Rieske 2Fe-2S domain-containing protein, partial [Brevibacterium sp.]|uniref:Rieske 2Fe-2S domain-containing protein n=1 Tax=Brevibacterium sp. TaxID=1701 RepID=UPI002648BAF1
MTLAPEVDPRTTHGAPAPGAEGATTGAGDMHTGANSTFDPDRLIDERRPGHCLDAPFYLSDEFFRRDIDAVFASTWIFAAAAAEVPEPGDFVTIDIGDYSVIIIRDDDENIRAHHNVCRHRGARLLSETNGSVG